jgi:hypothetical protein
LTRNGPILQTRASSTPPDPAKLEGRLIAIYKELRSLHPQDIQRARELQEDAVITAKVYQTATRGKVSITVGNVLGQIDKLLKTGFGKLGQFFTNLSKREATVEEETPLDVQAKLEQTEKERFLHTIRFRKTLPSL